MNASIFAPSDAFVSAFPPPPRVPAFAAPTVRPMARSFPKECRCGASYTPATWSTLPYGGVQQGVDELRDLELRHCDCGSTIAVELEEVAS